MVFEEQSEVLAFEGFVLQASDVLFILVCEDSLVDEEIGQAIWEYIDHEADL